MFILVSDEDNDIFDVKGIKNVTKTYMRTEKSHRYPSLMKKYQGLNPSKENSYLDQLLIFYQKSSKGEPDNNRQNQLSYENMLLKNTIAGKIK